VKKHLSTALKFSLSLGLGLAIVWFTFSKLTDEEMRLMRSAFANANYWWLILGSLLNLVSNIFRTQRWRMLLKPLGYKPSFVNTFFSVIVMYFANLLFPRLGEVMRCGILTRYEKIPVDKSIGTMVTERLVDVLTLPIIIGILLLVEKDRFYEALSGTQAITKNFSNNPLYSYILYSIIGLLIVFILYKVITDKFWIPKIQQFIKGIFQGLQSILKTESPLLFLFYSAMIWVCFFLAGYVSFFALPETSEAGPWAALALLFFGAIAFTAVQGGVGAYPLVAAKLLVVYGVAETIGLSFGWLAWTVQTGLVIIGGLLSLLILSIINKEA
jgi:glycosyltransferase 2 family protein